MITLVVALAGGLGAVARLFVDTAVARRTRADLPLGIVVVNLTGSFLVGMVTGLVLFRGSPGAFRDVAGTGFLGGYTTFSTASMDAVTLLRAGRPGWALLIGVGTLLGTLAAAGAGLALVS